MSYYLAHNAFERTRSSCERARPNPAASRPSLSLSRSLSLSLSFSLPPSLSLVYILPAPVTPQLVMKPRYESYFDPKLSCLLRKDGLVALSPTNYYYCSTRHCVIHVVVRQLRGNLIGSHKIILAETDATSVWQHVSHQQQYYLSPPTLTTLID